MMYKDRPEINQRNDSAYSQVLKEEALLLKKYYTAKENENILKEVLMDLPQPCRLAGFHIIHQECVLEWSLILL